MITWGKFMKRIFNQISKYCSLAVIGAAMLPALTWAETYDFVWYSGASQTWVYEAGPKMLVDVNEDPAVPNVVFFTFRNNLDTPLSYESSIADIEIDTGTIDPNMFTDVSIWDHSGDVRYFMFTPCNDPLTLLCGVTRIAWAGDYASGGLSVTCCKSYGVNPGEYVTLRATLSEGYRFSDVINSLNVGLSSNYVEGYYNQWTTSQKQYYRAEATKGLRFAILVQSIVPNSWNPDGHGLFVTHKQVDSNPPQIDSTGATPNPILDTETSQLSVVASDSDDGPQPLSYQWTIVSGGGVLDDATSATPVYTPADVVGTQTVMLRVTVTDSLSTISRDLTLTVEDANPPPPGVELLSEDFNSGSLQGWSVYDEGTISAPSNWRIVSGELAQLSNIRDASTASAMPHLGTHLSYNDGLGWTDYRARFKLRSTDDDSLGVMFRFQDNDNYYRFSWDKQLNQRRLVKKVGGIFTLLAADNVPYVMGQTYQVEIVAQGSQLEVWIDGTVIFHITDSSLNRGSIAFYTWQNNAAYFDDVVVEDLSGGNFNALPKITALTANPAAILDNQISNLTVTASDPDGGPEPLSYQWTIVSGGGVLNDATSPTPVYTPADIVGAQTVMLKVEVSDGSASVSSSLTITVEDANPPPLGPQLLFENFSSGTLSGWSARDEGTISAPSKWRIVSGELAQLSNIRDGGTASALPHLGTYLSYADGLGWTDYRARFKLRTTDDDTLGLMFRLQDNDNYYRFSWDKQLNQRRLVKKVGGMFSLLAADNVPYVMGQSYQVEIVAQGSQLEVWIDGARIFQITDASLARGSIAFYSWQNNAAFFDNVQVNAIE